MTRRIKILSITPTSGAVKGTIRVGLSDDDATGDWTSVFRGRVYRQKSSPYTIVDIRDAGSIPILADYQLVEATQFDVVDNVSYAGRYTVMTPLSGDPSSSTANNDFSTTIYVNEPIGSSLVPTDSSAGFITNVSTYYLRIGAGHLTLPPGIVYSDYPIDLYGRNFSGFGESLNQTVVNLFTNFAAATPPTNPLPGTLWYDTATHLLMIYSSGWSVVNAQVSSSSFRFAITTPTSIWVVNHGLSLSAPFIANVSFFIDQGGAIKQIMPADVSFDSANQLTATFSSPYTGYALISP